MTTTPMQVGTLVWPIAPPRLSLLVVVKATYELEPGGVATMCEEQLIPTGDLFVDDDAERATIYSSDFTLLKPRAECFFVGSCHAPRPDMGIVPVRFSVGKVDKRLVVFGPRRWQLRLPGPPEAFTSLPLTWEYALGGPSDPRNAHGMGLVPGADGEVALPRVESPSHLIGGPSDRPEPAGSGPLPLTHPARRRLAGTYDRRWQQRRWPWLPEDCHPEFFMAAPTDQRIDGYWRGDEAVELQNLCRARPLVQSRLPGLTPRAFVRRAANADRSPGVADLEEVSLRLDAITLMGDRGHAGQACCVWRGRIEVETEQAEDVADLFLLHEEAGRRREGPEVVAAFLQGLEALKADDAAAEPEAIADLSPRPGAAPPPLPPPPPDLPEQADGTPITDPSELEALYLAAGLPLPPAVAGYVADCRRARELDHVATAPKLTAVTADTREAGPDSEPAPMPGTAEAVIRTDAAPIVASAKRGELELAGRDLTGADLRGADLSRLDLAGALLAHADLAGADLRGADLSGAVLTNARLEDADLREARLVEAELSQADLTRADARGVDLSGATGEAPRLPGTRLEGARLSGAILSGADLSGADLSSADLVSADLSGARLVGARLVGARLDEASLEGADLSGALLQGASMAALRAADSIWHDADLRRARAPGAQLYGASFDRANLAFATLDDADLSVASLCEARLDGCSLQRVRLQKTALTRASLVKANLFEANLEAADLRSADLRGANLFSAQLWQADVRGTRLELANVERTHLEGK